MQSSADVLLYLPVTGHGWSGRLCFELRAPDTASMGPRSYPARASAVFLAGTTLWHGVPCAGANLLASHNWASEGLDMARNDPSVCNCSGNNSAIPDLSALDSNVSSSYGTSCAAWDQAAKYCSGSSVEAWCGEPWCYVNKQCYDKNPDLRPILYKSVYAAGYYYSYFICNTSKALPALKDEAIGKLQACGGSAAGLSNGLWSSDVCVRKGEYCKKMMFNAGVCTDTAARPRATLACPPRYLISRRCSRRPLRGHGRAHSCSA